jgi:hypothetical protein
LINLPFPIRPAAKQTPAVMILRVIGNQMPLLVHSADDFWKSPHLPANDKESRRRLELCQQIKNSSAADGMRAIVKGQRDLMARARSARDYRTPKI